MAIRHDQGIVLRSYPFGEADRVVVMLSPNHGKIRTVAKGIRKTKAGSAGVWSRSPTSICSSTRVATSTPSPRWR